MVWLVTCNGESACMGGLINSGNSMFIFGMIDGSNTMLLLAGAGGLIDSRDASSLGWSTVRLLMCNCKSACAGGLIDGGNTMLFLGMIDSGNTMLLHLAGQWWEGTLATRLV
jgi:hypothetical protein